MSSKINLNGTVFGKLTVLNRAENGKDGRPIYNCICECGKDKKVSARNLQRGSTIHCGCIKRTKKIRNLEASLNSLISSYKSNAKKRLREFSLTKEDCVFLFSNNCYYCGVEPFKIWKKRGCLTAYRYNGIDRLDNNVGYTKQNSVSCCTKCNYMKNNYSEKDFLDIIFNIAKNFGYSK